MSDRIDLSEKLATFSEHWSPRTVARFNDCDVMVVKVDGEFVWHKHDDTDDFFLVLKGVLDIQLRDRTVTLGPGQMYVVPKGVDHRPCRQGRGPSAADRANRDPKHRQRRDRRTAQDGLIHKFVTQQRAPDVTVNNQ